MIRRYRILTSKKFEKQLKRLPIIIKDAVLIWINTVENLGLREVRKIKGYHDEPLKGTRTGQRSVRLNKAYRLFYSEDDSGTIHLIVIEEVNEHEY